MSNLIRLFIEDQLNNGKILATNVKQAHYLYNVMRLTTGDQIMVFNGIDGEWSAKIHQIGKKGCILELMQQLKKQSSPSNIDLIFTPIKQSRIGYIIEKATELGVRNLQPVITERCINRHFNIEKLQAIAIEAAEQCESLQVPTVSDAIKLQLFCANQQNNYHFLLCNERGEGQDIATCLQNLVASKHYGLIIGPEGGFSVQELDYLKAQTNLTSIHLGSRILRSETAAIAALSCFQALVGDWQNR